MTTGAQRTCTVCGLKIPISSIGNRCPHCLLMLALTPDPEGAPSAAEESRSTPSRFFGNYELLQEFGRGGMGVVYRARHVDLNREVALKMTHSGSQASPEARMRFELEAAVVAKLDHPHIVTLLESGEQEGVFYFSMNLVDGGSLAEALCKADPRYSLFAQRGQEGVRRTDTPQHREPAIFLAKVARAVHYAHQHGILHRDLKPSNILIGSDGEPRIVDFGLAKIQDTDSGLTRTESVLGSPNYMAPEQAVASRATTATDIYSLGAILYEMLAGRPPFQAPTAVETMRRVLDEPPIPPHCFDPGVDRDLECVCLKCLEKEPARRYASANELAADLERWLDGNPTLARPVSHLERGWRWCKRKPGLALAILVSLLLLLTLVAGTSIASLRIHHAERRAVAHLREALLGQAQALLLSSETGARVESLRLVRQAAGLGGPLEFRQRARDQMLAALAHTGLAFSPQLTMENADPALALLDPRMERVALIEEQTNLVIRALNNGDSLLHLSVGPSAVVHVEAFSPDGRYLALRHRDGLSFWDLEAGRLCFATNGPGRRFCFATQAPQVVLEEGNDTASFLELPSFRVKHRLRSATEPSDGGTNEEAGRWRALALSPDGTLLARAQEDGNRLEVIEVASGRRRWQTTTSSPTTALAYSAARHQLMAATSSGAVYVFDLTRGRRVRTYSLGAPVRSLALDDPSSLLAVACEDQTIRLVQLAARRKKLTTRGDCDRIYFNPDRLRVGSVWRESSLGWLDLTTSREFSEWGVASLGTRVQRCEFSPDGRVVVAGYQGRIDLRRVEDGQELLKFRVQSIPISAFDPQGEFILTSDGNGIRRWTLRETRGGTTEIPPGVIVVPGIGWRSVEFNPEGDRIVAGNVLSNTVYLLDRTFTNRLAEFGPHKGVETVAISPDSQRIATGGGTEVKVWNRVTGELLFATEAGPRSQVDFSGDGRWLLIHGETFGLRDTRFWDLAPPLRLLEPQLVRAGAAAFSPDGRWLAVVDHQTDVQLFDVASWTAIGRLVSVTQARLQALAFSPDATSLAAACSGGRMFLWRLDRMQEKLTEVDLGWNAPPFGSYPRKETQPVELRLVPE